MATLQGQKLKDTYKEVLKLDNSVRNDGVGATLVAVEDGAGTDTALQLSTTQIASGVDGSQGTPAITRSNDPNTGIFFPAADTIAFSEGGAEAMRIDSAGNIGIGTNSPVARLDLGLGVNTFVAGTERLVFPSSPAATGIATLYGPNIGSSNRTYLHFTGLGAGSTFAIGVHGYQSNNPAAPNYLKVASGLTTGANVSYYRFDNDGFKYFCDSNKVSSDPDYTPTERFRIDSVGNIGMGITPSAIISDFKAIELGSTGNGIFGGTGGFNIVAIGNNAFFSGASQAATYARTGAAGQYRIQTNIHSWYIAPSGTANTAITFTEAMQLDSGGRLGIGLTPTARNNTRLQIVDGIGFPATQVASSDPNTLDDYEEGTWTPVVADATSGGNTTTAGTQTGHYRRIGSVVMAWFRLTDINTTGLTAGNILHVTGLPFATGAIADRAYGNIATANVTFGGYCVPEAWGGATSFVLNDCQTGAAYTRLLVSAFTDDQADLNGVVIYIV